MYPGKAGGGSPEPAAGRAPTGPCGGQAAALWAGPNRLVFEDNGHAGVDGNEQRGLKAGDGVPLPGSLPSEYRLAVGIVRGHAPGSNGTDHAIGKLAHTHPHHAVRLTLELRGVIQNDCAVPHADQLGGQ